MSLEAANACDERCKGKTNDLCCLHDCDNEQLEIFDGKIKNENIAKMWTTRADEKLADAWISTIEKSIEKCIDTSEYSYFLILIKPFESSKFNV